LASDRAHKKPWRTRWQSDPFAIRAASLSEGRPAALAFAYTIAGMLLRGIWMWLVVPIGVVVRVLTEITAFVRRSPRTPPPTWRQWVTFLDMTLLAAAERSVLRPLGMVGEWPERPKTRDVSQATTNVADAL
jgi:hypothetical protein